MGELQRRIEAKSFEDHICFEDTVIATEDLSEIVEEMKKEFPCYPTCQKYTSNMSIVPIKDSNIRCDKGCFAWKKWYKKWLVDEQP
jgi:cobalamin biosynthesis Co2+ chelatase CbiK